MSNPSSHFRISPLTREFIVGCVILVAVIFSRGFSIVYPAELSADESELLVQIDRYEHDLMPWRSVDGSTIGPVNPWFLLVVKQTGWPISYSGIHFLSALLQALIAIVSYYTVRLFLPFGPACLAGLAGTLALAGSASINFMYFATELVPALALSLAVLGLVIYQLMMLHRQGQTIGKRAMKVRIVRTDGSHCGIGRLIALRWLVPALIGAIPLVGGLFSLLDPLMIFRENRLCLHDNIADTKVVQA